jgi:tight adherence protein B
LYQQIFLASLLSFLIAGGALIHAFQATRRRARIEPRLKALAAAAPVIQRVAPSLRRPSPARRGLPGTLVTRLDASLAAAGNQISILRLVALAMLSGAMILAGSAAIQIPPASAIGLAGAAALGTPALLVRFAQNRYQRRFLDLFPDALDLIVRAVRAGLPVLEAMEVTAREIGAPVGKEFEGILGEIQIGVELEDALQHAADRIRVPDFRFFVVSLLLQRQTGGGIAEILTGLSIIIRQRKQLRAKARALTAEAKASTAVVAAMPFIAGAGLFLINREMMSVLFVDPRGRFMLAIATTSLLLGIAVMKAMINRSLRENG